MDLSWQYFPAGAVMILAGAFDASQVDAVLREANGVLQQSPATLAVDGRLLTLVDSSALGCLVQVAQRCVKSGCRFILVNFPASIYEIIVMTKLDKMLPHYTGDLAELVASQVAGDAEPAGS